MGESQISGTWVPLDRQIHINCLELKAVEAALHHWAPVLQGHQVMIATDNSTVVSYINKQGGTRSHTLLCLVVELFSCPSKAYPRLSERDSRPPISSQPADTDRGVEIMSQIFGVLGTPVVDMFATVLNASLPQFMSPIPEPRALAVNAVSQILSQIFCHNRIRDTSWTESLHSYRLHSWRLSCDTTKQQAFQMRSLGLPWHLGDPQPIACTTIGGFASPDGLQGRDLTRLIPQLLK